MKNIFKITLSLLVITSVIMTSCIKEDFDQPEIPDPCMVESGMTPNITIKGISDMFLLLDSVEGSVVRIFPDTNVVVSAVVVSDDKGGNFYKVLYLEDESGTLSLSIEGSGLFNDYPVGQTVHLNLAGLTIEFDEWVSILEVGMGTFIKDGAISGIGRIPVSVLGNFLKNSSCANEPTPKVIDLLSVNPDNIGRLVKIENIQFVESDTSSTYADAENKSSVSLTLVDCDDNPIILRTSGYANFAGLKVPSGRGSVVGIYTKYGNDYQLVIRDTADVQFDKNRCGGYEIKGTSKVVASLNEDFESGVSDEDFVLDGWLNANKVGGEYWITKKRDANKAVQISGFGSTSETIESWLVTPGVIIAANQKLFFDNQTAYWKHHALTVLISTDFDGSNDNLLSSTWVDVTDQANIATWPLNNFDSAFIEHSEIDLSSYDGQTIYVLFKYIGNNSTDITYMEVDNVIISN